MIDIQDQIERVVSELGWERQHDVGTPVLSQKTRNNGVQTKALYICEVPSGECPRDLGYAIMEVLGINGKNIKTWVPTKQKRAIVLREDNGLLAPISPGSVELRTSGGMTFKSISFAFRTRTSTTGSFGFVSAHGWRS